MIITGEHTINLPRTRVWQGLMSNEVLKASIPGCESIEETGPDTRKVVLLASVGPVKARFTGNLKLRDLHEPESYELDFEGSGGLAGNATGKARIELADGAGEGTTQLRYSAETQVGGRIAQIGSRLIDATVAKMSGQFFDRFETVIKNPGMSSASSMEQAAGTVAGTAAPQTWPGGVTIQKAGNVTVSMPAWTWIATLAILALCVGWIGSH